MAYNLQGNKWWIVVRALRHSGYHELAGKVTKEIRLAQQKKMVNLSAVLRGKN